MACAAHLLYRFKPDAHEKIYETVLSKLPPLPHSLRQAAREYSYHPRPRASADLTGSGDHSQMPHSDYENNRDFEEDEDDDDNDDEEDDDDDDEEEEEEEDGSSGRKDRE